MQKFFLKYYLSVLSYHTFEESQAYNFIMQDLLLFLRGQNRQDISLLHQYFEINWETLHLSKIEGQDKVVFWNSDYTKQMADIKFNTKEELDLYYLAYRQYCKRRWDDMSKLEMSLKNYEDILQKWNEILERQLQYIIISQDDSGYVDLVGKDELSEQDLADMRIEHEKYLKYKVAYDKYVKSRPDIIDELWHGPESSEYEADWQKYLDEPLD